MGPTIIALTPRFVDGTTLGGAPVFINVASIAVASPRDDGTARVTVPGVGEFIVAAADWGAVLT